jgi:hypothetical protein
MPIGDAHGPEVLCGHCPEGQGVKPRTLVPKVYG